MLVSRVCRNRRDRVGVRSRRSNFRCVRSYRRSSNNTWSPAPVGSVPSRTAHTSRTPLRRRRRLLSRAVRVPIDITVMFAIHGVDRVSCRVDLLLPWSDFEWDSSDGLSGLVESRPEREVPSRAASGFLNILRNPRLRWLYSSLHSSNQKKRETLSYASSRYTIPLLFLVFFRSFFLFFFTS